MNTVTHKQQIEGNPDNAGNINGDTNDSNPNNHKIDGNSRTLYPPCETWQNEPLHREMLRWSQCSKQDPPLELKLMKTRIRPN